VLPWDRAVVAATTEIKAALAATGTPLDPNYSARLPGTPSPPVPCW